MSSFRLFFFVCLLALAPAAFPKDGGYGARHSSSGGSARSTRCSSCARNSEGQIARSSAAVREFKSTHPCPGSCEGMVVDHIVPLKRGGADEPFNMQWQTEAEAAAKDKIE